MSDDLSALYPRAIDRMMDEIPFLLEEPHVWGDRLCVAIDEDYSYGQLQGHTPAWLTLTNHEPGWAEFMLDERWAPVALTQ